ncbi:hypothetical protein HN51_071661 [Arachis hypogaea]
MHSIKHLGVSERRVRIFLFPCKIFSSSLRCGAHSVVSSQGCSGASGMLRDSECDSTPYLKCIGNPLGFVRSMGLGIRDFLSVLQSALCM